MCGFGLFMLIYFRLLMKNMKYLILKYIYFCVFICFLVLMKSNYDLGNFNFGKFIIYIYIFRSDF